MEENEEEKDAGERRKKEKKSKERRNKEKEGLREWKRRIFSREKKSNGKVMRADEGGG